MLTFVRTRCGDRRRATTGLVASLVFSFGAIAAPAAWAQGHEGHGAGGDFGTVDFPISCDAAVRADFNRGVALLHSFFYPETQKAFEAVVARDPSCAMGYWGLAISQRPNPLTAPFPPALLKRGWEEIQRARRATTATPRERTWIEALAPFFEGHDTVPQHVRTERYEARMAALHASDPSDVEAAVFYALSRLEAVDLTDKAYTRQLSATAILTPLGERFPNHPGVPHYLIHAYDYAPIAARGLPAARHFASVAPAAPHALHMPSHIFSTLGMWQDAIDANLAADKANYDYAVRGDAAVAQKPGAITGRYHPLDFLVNAYLQLGADEKARAIVDLRNSPNASPLGGSITAHTGFAAIPARYVLEREAWAEAAAIDPRDVTFKQAEAIVRFTRALGQAHLGAPALAELERARITRLRQALDAEGDPYWSEQAGILEAAAGAWIRQAEGRRADAEALMRDAADREDRSEKHVAMENRLSPMRELLGELLLAQGRGDAALVEFQRSLEVVPNRLRSLAGAARAAAAGGDRTAAAGYYRRVLALTASGDGRRPVVAEARKYLNDAATPGA